MRYTIPILIILATPAQAVSLGEIIRNCSDDGKTYCPKVARGKPMQDCLTEYRKEITPACRGVVDRLNSGEKFTLF